MRRYCEYMRRLGEWLGVLGHCVLASELGIPACLLDPRTASSIAEIRCWTKAGGHEKSLMFQSAIFLWFETARIASIKPCSDESEEARCP